VPFTHFFMIPRWILGWSLFWFVGTLAFILMIGQDKKNPAKWRRNLMQALMPQAASLLSFLGGY